MSEPPAINSRYLFRATATPLFQLLRSRAPFPEAIAARRWLLLAVQSIAVSYTGCARRPQTTTIFKGYLFEAISI